MSSLFRCATRGALCNTGAPAAAENAAADDHVAAFANQQQQVKPASAQVPQALQQ